MRQICKAWGASGHNWVLSQENRSGRAGTILIPYMRAGGVLHVYNNMNSHGYKVEMMLVAHARPLLCRDTAFHCVTSSVWGSSSKFLLHSCSSAPECIKPPSQTEGCYQTNARKKKNLSVRKQQFLQRSGVVMVFQAKQKAHWLLCPTWNSAVRLKGKGFKEGFSVKWRNVGDRPATSGERGWDLALGYLTFLVWSTWASIFSQQLSSTKIISRKLLKSFF